LELWAVSLAAKLLTHTLRRRLKRRTNNAACNRFNRFWSYPEQYAQSR
jgi:hypothetical protein